MPKQKWEEEEAKEIGPSWPGGVTIERQGAKRRRIRISKTFEPVLTKRQRTVLKGKARTNRAWTRVMAIMNETGMTMEEFVKQLSPEELVRGYVKDKNGKFGGRPPQWVPRAFHRACLSELIQRGQRLWQENYLRAIEVMAEIASGQGAGKLATPNERLKAAQFIVERLEGKVPERLIVSEENEWQGVLDGIVAEVSDEQVQRGMRALAGAHEVIEGSTVGEPVDEQFIVNGQGTDDEPPPRRTRSRSPADRRRAAAVARRGRR